MSGVTASLGSARRRRPAAAAALLTALCLAVTGCTGTPTPSPVPTPGVAPLRGTPLDPADTAHPALSVKIDNLAPARPQIGLERADLVFEELVEGGLTRYAAVWHSEVPDEVGPVRSIRPMDPDILTPLGGIVAYSGGQPQFVAAMQQTGLVNVIFGQDDTGLFYRADDRSAPHNLVLNAAEVVRVHADVAAPERQFDYADGPAASTAVSAGAPSTGLEIRFSAASARTWTWDAATALYQRGQDGAPDLDAAGDPLTAGNVVVLRVDVDRTADVPRTIVTGSGEGSVSTGGSAVAVSWEKAAPADPIRLTDGAGEVVRLAPGATWIELVPADDGGVDVLPSAAEQ